MTTSDPSSPCGAWRRRTAAALIALASPAAWTAEPVFVTQGDARGQAHTVALRNACYAYSAAHLFRSKTAPVALVDKDGFRADAKLIAADTQLDLALLEVIGGAVGNRQLCRRGKTITLLHTAQALPALQREGASYWIDHVTTEAGGLARVGMGLARKASTAPDVIAMLPSGRRTGAPGSDVGDGFSGASVWTGPARADRQRFRDSDDPANTRGKVLGVLVGSKEGVFDVIRAEALREFIFGALQPVRWGSLKLSPANARFVDQRRGHYGALPAQKADMPLGDGALDRLSFEIEVHDVDTLLEGVRFHFDPATATRTPAPRRNLQVETSDVPPAGTKRWKRETCVADRQRDRSPAAANTLTCTVRDRRLVRGVRLQLDGDPVGLRGIELVVRQ